MADPASYRPAPGTIPDEPGVYKLSVQKDPAPLFEGDTVYAQSKVLSTRESKSRPNMGIVELETIGFKQDGTVVMTFRRTILVYKRGHVPMRPEPSPGTGD